MQLTRPFVQADATALPFADGTFDATIASPSYAEARTYGIGADREIESWATWMADVTVEALRVTRGPVIWIVDDQVMGHALRPGVFLLGAELYRRGIALERPVIWRSNKAPSRHGYWWCHAWEYIFCAKHPGKLPYFDWRATATKTQYGYHGGFRQRDRHGNRKPRSSGYGKYKSPEFSNPRDIIYAKVGGGHMGHPMATDNEAPFPESLVSQIIPVVVPLGGRVLDCFSGSGTTVAVARKLGRIGIGCDLRMSQCELGVRRLATPYAKKVKKLREPKPEPTLFNLSSHPTNPKAPARAE